MKRVAFSLILFALLNCVACSGPSDTGNKDTHNTVQNNNSNNHSSNVTGGTTGGDGSDTCGDGVVDTAIGETCDPKSTTQSCKKLADECRRKNVDDCEKWKLVGKDCQKVCEKSVITEPKAGDLCCPAGANASNDPDCAKKKSGEPCNDKDDCLKVRDICYAPRAPRSNTQICITPCTDDNDCKTGYTCVDAGEIGAPQNLCLPKCDTSNPTSCDAFKTSSTINDLKCRTFTKNGNKSACYYWRDLSLNTGGECLDKSTCGVDGECFTEHRMHFYGGYCTAGCVNANCPSDSKCIEYGTSLQCFKTCDPHDPKSCRLGYFCDTTQQNTCQPNPPKSCTSILDCDPWAFCDTSDPMNAVCHLIPASDSKLHVCTGNDQCRDWQTCVQPFKLASDKFCYEKAVGKVALGDSCKRTAECKPTTPTTPGDVACYTWDKSTQDSTCLQRCAKHACPTGYECKQIDTELGYLCYKTCSTPGEDHCIPKTPHKMNVKVGYHASNCNSECNSPGRCLFNLCMARCDTDPYELCPDGSQCVPIGMGAKMCLANYDATTCPASANLASVHSATLNADFCWFKKKTLP